MHPAAPQPDTSNAALTPGSAAPMAALVASIGAAAAALVLWLVPQFEGTIFTGYRDIGGVVTACTGNTSGAVLGKHYTAEECRTLLASDLVRHNAGLNDCLRVQLPDHVRAALLSWAFNVGVGNACSSTLMRRVNAGDLPGACAEISRWTFVAGHDCALAENTLHCGGIVTRRAAERRLCEGQFIGAPAAALNLPAASGAST